MASKAKLQISGYDSKNGVWTAKRAKADVVVYSAKAMAHAEPGSPAHTGGACSHCKSFRRYRRSLHNDGVYTRHMFASDDESTRKMLLGFKASRSKAAASADSDDSETDA
jgi:hypothetical protein